MGSNDVWVLGTGDSLNCYKEDIKQLKDNYTTLAFHRAFPHCVEHFGLYPTYWTWYDPDASILGLTHLTNLSVLPPNMKIIIPETHRGSPVKLAKHIKKNGYGRDKAKMYANCLRMLAGLESRGMDVECFPSKSALFVEHTVERKKVKSIGFEERFCINDHKNPVIFGTDNWDEKESKLTYYILPLIQFMGFKRAFIGGFAGVGGRFFDAKWIVTPSEDSVNLEHVKSWQEWLPKLDLDAYTYDMNKQAFKSLVDANRYVDAKEALSISRPRPHITIETKE